MKKKFLYPLVTIIVLFTPLSIFYGIGRYDASRLYRNLLNNETVTWGFPSEFEHHVLDCSEPSCKIGKNLMRQFQEDKSSRKHLILAGGSNTYGHGLVNPTPLDIFRANISDVNIQTISYPGWGPSNVLMRLKSLNLESLIPQQEGVFVYQYFSFHKYRVCGGLKYFLWALGVSPEFDIINGEFKYIGSFNERWYFPGIYTLRGLMSLKIPVELETYLLTKPHCDRIIEELFKEMKKEYLVKFPRGKFIVLNMPNSFDINVDLNLSSDISIDGFLEYLKAEAIDYRDEKLYQPDGHYGVQMNEHLAKFYKKLIKDSK